jgi:CheY-like chemotaxis protein
MVSGYGTIKVQTICRETLFELRNVRSQYDRCHLSKDRKKWREADNKGDYRIENWQGVALAPETRYNTSMESNQGPILVVEDMPQIRTLLEVTLRFDGHPVDSAGNGVEALEKIKKVRPVLIISDILMPQMDGFAMVYHLRTNPETRDIPVVFLSATYVTREDKDFALSLGAARFLEKPIEPAEFLITIGEVLAEGSKPLSDPLAEPDFFAGYQTRLETKLRQKNQQIDRTRRLLETLSEAQKPTFETLLAESLEHRAQIIKELEEIIQTLKSLEEKD